jgi:hypothetical protein
MRFVGNDSETRDGYASAGGARAGNCGGSVAGVKPAGMTADGHAASSAAAGADGTVTSMRLDDRKAQTGQASSSWQTWKGRREGEEHGGEAGEALHEN